MNRKIIPHLWFDNKALQAVDFYIDLFEDSIILNENELRNTPSGDIQLVEFEIGGIQFQAINGGPYFDFNNAVSLMVYCKSEEEANSFWNVLKEDAVILKDLTLDENKQLYGSLKDKFNLVWQVITVNGAITQKIIPNLLFSGKAQEAMIYYGQVFPHSVIKFVDQRKDASLIFAHFKIEDLEFISMDVKGEDNPGFNESISFMVMCDDQREVDFYTDILSADPEAE